MQIPQLNSEDISSILTPGLIGAGAGGLLSTAMARRVRDPREDATARRRRILRNALIGTALGGGAGAGLSAGSKTLFGGFSGDNQESLLSRAITGVRDFGIDHSAALGTTGLGLLSYRWLARRARANAVKRLEGLVRSALPDEKKLQAFAQARSSQKGFRFPMSLDSQKELENLLGAKDIDLATWISGNRIPRERAVFELLETSGQNPFNTMELMRESGLQMLFRRKPTGPGDLAFKLRTTDPEPLYWDQYLKRPPIAESDDLPELGRQLEQHLLSEADGLSGRLNRYVARKFTNSEPYLSNPAAYDRLKKILPKSPEILQRITLAPQDIGYAYSKYVRPSSRASGMHPATVLPFVPPAALMAEGIQRNITG